MTPIRPIQADAAEPSAQMASWARVLRFLKHEFFLILPPTIFFAVGFNLVALSTNLILGRYLVDFSRFMLATTAALIVGKAVLVADTMPLLRRFDAAPLIRPILFKTAVYWVFVFIARLLEAIVHYLVDNGTLAGAAAFLLESFSWHRFAFIQLWILVLFLIYVTASEFNALFGQGELARILFRHRSTELKLGRRQRIRTLTQLNRLTEKYSTAELADPKTRVHNEFVHLIEQLAAKTAKP
jgi:hypothetical protein